MNFKNEKELVEYVENEVKLKCNGKVILLSKSGSKLYGTDNENSDDDYLGVFVAGLDYHLGLKEITEIDLSVKSKNDNGKNDKNAIDIKLYELKKFARLVIANNPNITELLFVEENLANDKETFKKLQNLSDKIINKRVFHSFYNYAKSQMNKGVVKAQNYQYIKEFYNDILEALEKKTVALDTYLSELKHFKEFQKDYIVFDKSFLSVNGLNFNYTINIKKAKNMLEERLKFSSHRQDNWEKYGYDTKFFMHLFRLLYEGEMLIKNKSLQFPLPIAKELKEIRNGKYSLNEISKLAEEKMNNFNALLDEVEKMPNNADYEAVSEVLVEINKDILHCH